MEIWTHLILVIKMWKLVRSERSGALEFLWKGDGFTDLESGHRTYENSLVKSSRTITKLYKFSALKWKKEIEFLGDSRTYICSRWMKVMLEDLLHLIQALDFENFEDPRVVFLVCSWGSWWYLREFGSSWMVFECMFSRLRERYKKVWQFILCMGGFGRGL